MGERINYNMGEYAKWLKEKNDESDDSNGGDDSGSSASGGSSGGDDDAKEEEFNPPCKTKFWQDDTYEDCPTLMSVAQCCSIITKPVVPANLLKIRTQEGVLTAVRQDGALQGMLQNSANEDTPKTAYVEPFFQPTALAGGDDLIAETAIDTNLKYHEVAGEGVDDIEPEEYVLRKAPFMENRHYYAKGSAEEYGYMGMHMPYMRWWDTSAAAGNPRRFGSFMNTRGTYDTIVGVGREGADVFDVQAASTLTYTDEWNPIEHGREAGNLGGWAELMAHQMWSLRYDNFFCLGRYEKLFKPKAEEDFVLHRSGTAFENKLKQESPWPRGWRGYAENFPYWLNPGNIGVYQGLDNVLPGDIIRVNIAGIPKLFYVEHAGFYDPLRKTQSVLTDLEYGKQRACFNTAKAPARWWVEDFVKGIAYEAIPNFIMVQEVNHGKVPSSTGITTELGVQTTKTIYKYLVPNTANLTDELYSAGTKKLENYTVHYGAPHAPLVLPELPPQNSCDDPYFVQCVLPNGEADWDNALIFRPYLHTIMCNDPTLAATYNYTPDIRPACYPKTWQFAELFVNTQKQPPSDVIPTSGQHNYPSDIFASCINDGYDPPRWWIRGYGLLPYRGAGAGTYTDTNYCPPLPTIQGTELGAWSTCGSVHLIPEGIPGVFTLPFGFVPPWPGYIER